MVVKTLVEEAPKKMPIMSTCWGYEFLNVLFGGSLIQHIDDPEKKHLSSNRNKIILDPESWVSNQILSQTLEGACNHHQNLDKIPDKFKVIARDVEG